MEKGKHYKHENIGNIAGILGIIALVPLAWDVMQTNVVKHLNILWLLIRLLSTGMLLYFGIINKITPIIIASGGVGIILLYLLGMKIYMETVNGK